MKMSKNRKKVAIELSELDIYVLRIALSYYKGSHGRTADRLDERLYDADRELSRPSPDKKEDKQ
jgi:hypothetical protein